jgi:prepilin-type N-terminal cleavage/methylation domain-containing protein
MQQRVRPALGRDRGFTLVELLIVIVCLGILAGIVVFGVARFRSDAEASACREDVSVVNSAADARLAATGVYPVSVAELVAGGYLTAAPTTGTYAFDAATGTATRTPACAGTTTTASAAATTGPGPAMTAAEWKVVFGAAVLSGTTVDIPFNGRVMSVRPGGTSDVVFATTATFRSGQGGYGMWVRASLATTATLTGYSFQYDVGYGNAYVLRQWYNGNECTQPLAVSKMATGLAVNGAHSVAVTAKGDTLVATVDGAKVLDVPSLSTVVGHSTCGYPLATGTDTGFRTFGVASALFSGTTLS